jgi:hypothetical protein
MSSKEVKTCDSCGKNDQVDTYTNIPGWLTILVQRNETGNTVDTKGDACSIECAIKILDKAMEKLRSFKFGLKHSFEFDTPKKQ